MKNPIAADEKEYEFEFEGALTKADIYGSDFLPELRRVVESITSWRTNDFLEWGSGLSTLLLADVAAHRGGHLVTLDNDPKYLGAVSKAVPDQSSITALAVDLIGPRNSQSDPELNYTTLPLSFYRDFDFVLIDGRRRLECAFCSLLLTHAESVVVLHDYRRTRYQVVHSFFDTIEAGPQFLVMRPKPELLRAIEPLRDETRRLFRNSRQGPAPENSADPAQLYRIIQARDETIALLQGELSACLKKPWQAASGEILRAQLEDLENAVSARDVTIALLSDQIAEVEKKNSLLSAQLALETKELNQITSSLGWRLLSRYGHVKYRFLLPVYRMLGLPPYGPKGRN